MLYAAYEAQRAVLDGARTAARAAIGTLDLLPTWLGQLDPVRRVRAAHQMVVDTVVTHRRLAFGIEEVAVTGRDGAAGFPLQSDQFG